MVCHRAPARQLLGSTFGNSIRDLPVPLARPGRRRSQSLEILCQDVVFIARKLGYARIWIRLEDGDKVWQLADINKEDCYCSQHKLPGHRHCFLELSAPRSLPGEPQATAAHTTNEATLKITGDLLAEGLA